MPDDSNLLSVPTEPTLVDTADELARCCARWRRLPALGVDTEFVRTRTFFARLGLIQLGDGERNVLVDPVKIEDLDPLAEIFQAENIVKVFHSCGEDLEVLYHRFEAVPHPLFDNQLAAALTGMGSSLSYHRLVQELFDVDLPKGETRSNWMKRPLSDAQQRYAGLDVAYLLPTWEYLRPRLEARGRDVWLEEEIDQLGDPDRFLPDPDEIYHGFANHSLDPRQLAALRSVAAWREREARRRDLPRNFVLPKQALVSLVRVWPRSERELDRVKGLRDEDIRRHGRHLLGLLRDARKLPRNELPKSIPRPLDLSPYRRQVSALRTAVADWAEELELPPELVANRRTLENLARRLLLGKDPLPPGEIEGWRRQLLADVLAEVNLGEKRGKASR